MIDEPTGIGPLPGAAAAPSAGTTDEDPGIAFEQLFVRQLLSEVAKAMPEGSFLGGDAGQFDGVFLDHLAEQVAAGGHLGLAEQMREHLAHRPGTDVESSVSPLTGTMTSSYGHRADPFTGAHASHHGVDIAAAEGTPIHAVRSGTVVSAGERGGYGNLVVLEHADGTRTRYAHCRDLKVQPGDMVDTGQVVGTVGQTGRATGPHLHFEVRKHGKPVDPSHEFSWAKKTP